MNIIGGKGAISNINYYYYYYYYYPVKRDTVKDRERLETEIEELDSKIDSGQEKKETMLS